MDPIGHFGWSSRQELHKKCPLKEGTSVIRGSAMCKWDTVLDICNLPN